MNISGDKLKPAIPKKNINYDCRINVVLCRDNAFWHSDQMAQFI